MRFFPLLRSIPILIRRAAVAAGLGFAFFGTTKTPFPKSVRLGGRRVILSTPPELGCLTDVINVWLDDEYGLRSIHPAPKTILDVGANIGIFSLWAEHRFPRATIHAYEPNPRAFQFLQANLAGVPATLFPAGLGARHGRANIIDSMDSRLASTVACADGEIEIESLAVSIERLGGSVDLMKIDCEGGEWDLFEDPTPFRQVKQIRMEYHLTDGRSLDEFKSKVNRLGFSVVKLLPNRRFGVAWLQRNGL